MRRVTVEIRIDHCIPKRCIHEEGEQEQVWHTILGPHSDDVEVLEIVRTFKCDGEGFAFTCKMMIRDENLRPEDLSGNGVLSNVETLHREEDASWMVYLAGKFPDPGDFPELGNWNPVVAGTPEFVDVDRVKVTLLMNEDEVGRFRQLSQKYPEELPLRILTVSSLRPGADSDLARLTGKQRKAQLLAYALGYYDVPRKIYSYDIARRLNVKNSTLVEHLRKAQRRLLSGILSG
ncbi:MAG: helix-turn-helix domain-containing protein [candidate division NC10 bacterium]